MNRRAVEVIAILGFIALAMSLSRHSAPSRPPLPTPPAGYAGNRFDWYHKEGQATYQRGYQLESQGQRPQAYALYAQAAQYYAQARREGERRGDILLPILNDQAWVEVCQQNWAREEPFRRELLEIRQVAQDSDPTMLAQAHYELARCLQRQGQHKESQQHYLEAIERQARAQTGPNWVYYDNYAGLLREMGLTSEADQTARRAQELKARSR